MKTFISNSRSLFLLFWTLWFSLKTLAQQDTITPSEVFRIINFLAGDSIQGRGNYTQGLEKAAFFIEKEFRKDSLLNLPGLTSYFQPFSTHLLSEKDGQKDTLGHFNPSKVLLNVIGVLKGTSLAGEAIIFCAHYDHIDSQLESDGVIFHGANDNASGTTALLELAHYYSMRKDNARTLIFCAFSGEELGLYGSSAFVPIINTEKIKAVINIEMIGRTNRNNSIFLTGARYSDVFNILKKNLGKQKIQLSYEPDERTRLFQRSDNYPFALKGIPAHTIQGSDDKEPCYHQVCDEVKRIDIAAMTDIIRAIVTGVRTLIDGTDTPRMRR